MATINTIEDLMRLLDESPEWLEAVRARILTRELLELPERLAQLAADFAEFTVTTNAAIAELQAGQQRLEGQQEALAASQRRMEAGIGDLRGLAARRTAIEQADLIARSMGFRWIRTLPISEIWDFAESPVAAGLPHGDLQSFRKADVIVEAADSGGQNHYITVEVSYTADDRDTRRAIRNAGYMTLFTGAPAHAAIVALHIDNRIRDQVTSNRVFWYEIGDDSLTPD